MATKHIPDPDLDLDAPASANVDDAAVDVTTEPAKTSPGLRVGDPHPTGGVITDVYGNGVRVRDEDGTVRLVIPA